MKQKPYLFSIITFQQSLYMYTERILQRKKIMILLTVHEYLCVKKLTEVQCFVLTFYINNMDN